MRQQVSKRRLAVLGASGATGRHVVASALQLQHEVTALVRRPGTFEPTPGLQEVVWPTVSDVGPVGRALQAADAVICVLGGAEKGPTSVTTDAMRTLVPAMVEAGVDRLVVLSAHGVLESRDRSLYSRAVWAGVADRMRDKESMEPIVTGSGLQWTIVRPPALKDGPETGRYIVGEDLPIRLWHSIGRADLADFLVQEADQSRFVHRHPRIRK